MKADINNLFNREQSDAIFTQSLDYIDVLNARDNSFEYTDLVTLHNDITALYDSFMDVDNIIESQQSRITELEKQLVESKAREKTAVEDLRHYPGVSPCFCCKHNDIQDENRPCKFIWSECFEWRGIPAQRKQQDGALES